MSRFTTAQREGILAEARANLSKKTTEVRTRTSPEIVYKTHVNAPPARDERTTPVASGAEVPWWEWVERCVDGRLTATVEGIGQAAGELHDEALRSIATLKRELDQLRQEVTALREQVGLERGLRDLREQVDQARSEVPKVPALVAGLEKGQARLRREVAATKDKLTRVRTNQCITDYRLGELRKATEARAAGMEMKIETSISAFVMREVHPDAGAALRDFATEALKDNRTLYTLAGSV
jgi:outer membrane murein-binding lipoprotein Lpp